MDLTRLRVTTGKLIYLSRDSFTVLQEEKKRDSILCKSPKEDCWTNYLEIESLIIDITLKILQAVAFIALLKDNESWTVYFLLQMGQTCPQGFSPRPIFTILIQECNFS